MIRVYDFAALGDALLQLSACADKARAVLPNDALIPFVETIEAAGNDLIAKTHEKATR